MKAKNGNFWPWLLASIILPILVATTEPTGLLRGIIITAEIISVLILLGGIVIIPNKPPHIGIVTKWDVREWYKNNGKTVVVYFEEGWHWLFLRGIMYKIISINCSKREIDFNDQIVITPDQVTTKIPSSLAYTLDPVHIINWLNLGGNPYEVLSDMIDDIYEDHLRSWAIDPKKGPATFKDLLSAKEEAAEKLILGICGETSMPQVDVQKIRSGNGKWPIEHFGIFLNRLNLKAMEPFGEVYEKGLLIEKEKKERESETYEVQTDLKKAKKLQKEFKKLNVEKSIDECMNLIMQWKIQREANSLLTIGAFAKNFADALKNGGRP